jgi:hypothetical protein
MRLITSPTSWTSHAQRIGATLVTFDDKMVASGNAFGPGGCGVIHRYLNSLCGQRHPDEWRAVAVAHSHSYENSSRWMTGGL